MNNRSLIDDWLPIAELGVESQRERGASSALPPLYFLHIWWTRKPLTASRAAVLGTMLPAWSGDWPAHLLRLFPTQKAYLEWFVDLLGIRGDPVADRQRILEAKEAGIKLARAYAGPRAFTLAPDKDQTETLRKVLAHRWGVEAPVVLDPTAGGGSIPFESIRFGFPTKANELNSVASFILEGTLTLPARFGPDLRDDIAHWGRIWADRVEARLKRFFPRRDGESIHAYLSARTVACPESGKPIPLGVNWWLRKKTQPAAIRLIAKPDMEMCRFEIVNGDNINFDPNVGTVRRGVGRSPWTGSTVPREYIWAEAQAGRMGSQLYAIATKNGRQLSFRPPNRTDLEALQAAATELDQVFNGWMVDDIVPNEAIPTGNKTSDAIRYGMTRWVHMFSPRQLLVMGTAVEELRKIQVELKKREETDVAAAVSTYLSMAVDKAADYCTQLCPWDPTYRKVAHVFSQHNFAFMWSFAEFDGAHNLLPWSVSQVIDAYKGLARLLEPSRQVLFRGRPEKAGQLVEVHNGDAADLHIEDQSVHAVVFDPPYYDSVQFAELSDFFYVWLKRTAGNLYPRLFDLELSEKATEAVSNPARFAILDKKNARKLARADYQAKMTRIFSEAHRVLVEGGMLTVMFNHKEAEAWDTLGRALIEGGFRIGTSWPVHTESQHSLHQAKKAAAASTILLACHKRTGNDDPVWWDDLVDEVRRTARDSAKRFRKEGIGGVDLYISTFGPVLSVISRQWPVFTSEVDPETGEPRKLRPEEALKLARREVADLRLRGMLSGHQVEFDPITDWYLLAWDSFQAKEFPYDDARKLALALGIDLDRELRRLKIVVKKQSSVVLQEPKQRRRPGLADTEATSFERLLDAAHALMVTHREDGVLGAEGFLRRTGLGEDSRFHALLQGMVNAIPRTKIKGRFVRPEAEDLDGLGILFPDLEFPEDPPSVLEPTQISLSLT